MNTEGKRSHKPVVKKETEEEKKAREMVEQIASNIASLATAVKGLLNGPLKRKALVVLLTSSSKLAQWQVEKVLEALESMEGDWLNK